MKVSECHRKDDSRELQEYLKEGCYKAVSKMFKEVSKAFKESTKCVSIKFQKKVSRVFHECFNEVLFLQFCSCMDLIAATQPEGGLVFYRISLSFVEEKF